MALDFDTTDRVSIAADASINTLSAFTWITWIYTDSTGTGSQVYALKGLLAGGNPRISLERKFGDVDDFEVVVRFTSTNAQAVTTGVNKPINTWFFVAFTFGSAQAANRCRVYTAPIGSIATEASYSSQTGGINDQQDDSANPLILGNADAFGDVMLGRMGFFHVISSELTLNQIIAQQYRPHVRSDSQVFMHLGFNGTGTQPDLTGKGNNGTVTGAVVADHVPLGPPFGFDIPWAPVAVAAAAGSFPPRRSFMNRSPHLRM